jgi:hypothetical protein
MSEEDGYSGGTVVFIEMTNPGDKNGRFDFANGRTRINFRRFCVVCYDLFPCLYKPKSQSPEIRKIAPFSVG